MKRALLALLTVGFLWVWLLVWDYFYESTPEGLLFRHRHGARAIAEEFIAALYAPAYFLSRAYEQFRSSSTDHLPFLILAVLQPWPRFLLCFRPWPRLSRGTRRAVVGYVTIWAVSIPCAFLFFHHLNEMARAS